MAAGDIEFVDLGFCAGIAATAKGLMPNFRIHKFKIQDSRFKIQDSRFKIQDFRSPTLSPRPFPPRRAGKGANSPIWQTLLNEVLPAVRQWAGSQADGWLGYGERARNNVTLTPIVQ